MRPERVRILTTLLRIVVSFVQSDKNICCILIAIIRCLYVKCITSGSKSDENSTKVQLFIAMVRHNTNCFPPGCRDGWHESNMKNGNVMVPK